MLMCWASQAQPKLRTTRWCTREQIEVLLTYILQAGDTPDPQALLISLAQKIPQYKEVAMNMAERLRKMGHDEGGPERPRRTDARGAFVHSIQ